MREQRIFTDEKTGETIVMIKVFTPLIPTLELWQECGRVPKGAKIQALVDLVILGQTAEQAFEDNILRRSEEWEP